VNVLADAPRRDDETLTEILRRILKPDDNCVDVGCNLGQILEQIVSLAPKGRHFAFEALPSLASEVARRFPTVTVSAVAISDENGTTSYRHVVNDPGYSGMRERRYDRPDPIIETITVPMRRLDGVLPADLLVRFIKIDVEGAELQVLRGAEGTIRAARPFVYFEHGRGGSEYYGTTPELIHRFLCTDCGLQIWRPSDWILGQAPLDVAAFRQAYERGDVWNYLAAP
jgi:FkbM family methyltransferase